MECSQMSLDHLQMQFELERELNTSLENSLEELKLSVEDLDKRMDDYDCDSNEWRTRFETQLELNQHLQHRASLLSDSIEQAKLTVRELKQPRTPNQQENITPDFLKSLQKSRQVTEEQLKNLEMRLEEESKAYHKSNEERKNLVLELNHLKNMADVQQSAFTFNFTSGHRKNLVRKLDSLQQHIN